MKKRFYKIVHGGFCHAIGTNKAKLMEIAKERGMKVEEITEREYDWKFICINVEQVYD